MVTYKMTSDEFFAAHGEKRYDLIFIDGLHHAEYVERDIITRYWRSKKEA